MAYLQGELQVLRMESGKGKNVASLFPFPENIHHDPNNSPKFLGSKWTAEVIC